MASMIPNWDIGVVIHLLSTNHGHPSSGETDFTQLPNLPWEPTLPSFICRGYNLQLKIIRA